MLGAIKAVPETIKTWHENREQLYNVIGCAAAVLVAIAAATGSRPTDSLAAAARSGGLSSVADWLTTSAPPFVAAHIDAVNEVTMFAALVLFAVMIVVPLVRGRHEDSTMFGYEFVPLIGSPAAATCWVLLAVAAQHGQVVPVLERWAHSVTTVGLWSLAALAVGGVLHLLASRHGLGSLIGILIVPLWVLVYRVVYGIGFAGLAVVLAGLGLPLSIISWMAGLESDHSRKIRAKIASERAEREQPTGALF